MVHELIFELGHKGSRWPVAVAVTDSGCHIPAVGPSALACLAAAVHDLLSNHLLDMVVVNMVMI